MKRGEADDAAAAYPFTIRQGGATMTISFPCSKCGQRYQVDGAMAGRRIKCKKCEAAITIPVPRQPAGGPAPSAPTSLQTFDAPETAPAPRPAPRPTANVAPAPAPARPAPRPAPAPRAAAPAYGLDDVVSSPPPVDLYGLDEALPSSPLYDDDEDDAAEGEPGGVVLTRRPLPARAKAKPTAKGKKKGKSRGSSGSGLGPVMTIYGGVILVMSLIFFVIGLIFGPENSPILGRIIGAPIVAISIAGFFMAVHGQIWFLVNSFREDAVCGLLNMFVPFYSLYYLITRWEEQWRPFTLSMIGTVAMLPGFCVIGSIVAMVGQAQARQPGQFNQQPFQPQPMPNFQPQPFQPPPFQPQPFAPPPPPPGFRSVPPGDAQGEILLARAEIQLDARAEQRRQAIVRKFGEDRVVTVQVKNVPDAAASTAIQEKIKSLLVGGSTSISASLRGTTLTVVAAPVNHIKGFANRLDFGTVTSVDRQDISVLAAPIKPAEPKPKPKPADRPKPAKPADEKEKKAEEAEGASKGKNKPLSIPIPPSFWGGEVLYPSTPSPFVAVGRNGDQNDHREIWDLRENKRIGAIRGQIPADKPFALSPDGTQLAAKAQGRNGVGIWSTKNGKFVGGIEVGTPGTDYLDFAGTNQLLTSTLREKVFVLWDLKTGKPVREITVPVPPQAVALSPDRKTLAVACKDDSTIRAFDLETGDVKFEEAIPKEGIFNTDCKGLAYSPDGKELAGLFLAFNKGRFLCWKAENGELNAELIVDDKAGFKETFGYEGPGLVWLADGSGWIVFGSDLADRQTGQRLLTIPTDDPEFQKQPKRPIDGDRVLVVSGTKERRYLRPIPLPKEQIARAAQAVKSGGDASDALLPPLTTADRSQARKVAADGNGEAPISPDAGPAPKGGLASRPVVLKCPAGEVQRIAFSAPDVGRAAVGHGPGGNSPFNDAERDAKPRQVDVFDLASGQALGRVEVPGVQAFAAFSPDGSRLLFQGAKDQRRLDVYSAADGKHVVGWQPYDKQAGELRSVTWAAFLDADRVLTMNKGGVLALWSIPACRAEWIVGGEIQGAPALSPGRKSLATFRNGVLQFRDPATGEIQATAPAASPAGLGPKPEAKGLAFSADGRAVAGLLNGTDLVVWDVATAKVANQFKSPAMGSRVSWRGLAHVMVDERFLLDLRRQRKAWTYWGGQPAAESIDGRHWFAAGQFHDNASLAALTLPEPRTEQLATLADDPKAQGVLKRGSKLSLQFNLTGPPRDPDGFRKSFATQVGQALSGVGVTIAQNEPVRLVINVEEKPGGELRLREFGAFPGGPGTQTIQTTNLICSAWLADGKGKIELAPPNTIGMQSFGIIHIPADEKDVAAFLKTQQWNSVKGWFGGIGVPTYVGRGPEGVILLPGSSNLDTLGQGR